MSMKNFSDTSGIEPAAFRVAAQYLTGSPCKYHDKSFGFKKIGKVKFLESFGGCNLL
jgi:hypothetical protein